MSDVSKGQGAGGMRRGLTCRELVDFLGDYFAGALPPEARDVFDDHLAGCPDCFSYAWSYQKTMRLGRMALLCPEETVPEEAPEELIQAILAARRPRNA